MIVDKNILASAIAEGKDPEEIAKELITALNDAIIINKEAEEAAEAEKAQLEAAGVLLAALTSYIADYCPNMLEVMENEEDDLEPEDIVDLMAMLDEGFLKSKEIIEKAGSMLNDLFTTFDLGGKIREIDEKPLKPAAGTSPKMPVSLRKFLEENGL